MMSRCAKQQDSRVRVENGGVGLIAKAMCGQPG